jgi:sugar phosphate isomerase/epimerase
MGLKLGAATYTYLYECTLDEAIRRLADHGFRFFELTSTPPHPTPEELDGPARRRLAQLCARLGIQPLAVQPTFADVNLATLNRGIREESVRQIQGCIQLASDLGASIVVVVPGRVRPLIPPPFADSLAQAAGSLEACLLLAERLGITLALESTPYSITPDAARLLQLVDRLGHPQVGVALDVANNSMVEPPEGALRAVRPHLRLVHVSDTMPTQWLHAAVGDGSLDFASIARTLHEIGYEGPTILETTVADDPDGALRRSRLALEPLGWSV